MKCLCVLFALSAIATAAPTVPPDPEEAAYPAIERFVEVLESVRRRHPDADKVAYERLINHALEGMLSSLDPFSSFIHPEMVTLLNENSALQPEVASLGLTLGLRSDGPYIAAVAPLFPAAEAGILPGTVLLAIDGKMLTGIPFPDLLPLLQRPPGTTTRLLLKTLDEQHPVEKSIVHRRIAEKSVPEARLLPDAPTTGYLRLATFGNASAREVETALDDLEDAGMKNLILDLRQNGGGDLHQTVQILGLFLPPSTTVVTTRGRDGKDQDPLKTPDRQRRKRSYPLCVLIDRMSASASELTAGALQDLKRATILGQLSYGKGSVQNIIPMGGGTALRLTIATYHTPSGNTPHLKGITPDIPVTTTPQDAENFRKTTRRETLTPDELKTLAAWQDPVLLAALKKLSPPSP